MTTNQTPQTDFSRISTVHKGNYRGIYFAIHNWKDLQRHDEAIDYPTGHWNYYIYLPLSIIPIEYKPDSFWLRGKKGKYGKMIVYDYYKHDIIKHIEFHGGCTYYSKQGDGVSKCIELGCDYGHIFDSGTYYDLPTVFNDCKQSIDSLHTIIPTLMV